MSINESNVSVLQEFINTINDKHFRYYQGRTIDIIKNHVYTVLLKCNSITVGYAHIDFEDKYWVGIYLHPEYRNKGIGKFLLSYIISNASFHNIDELHLSVDHDNNAIFLYTKIGFTAIQE